VHLAFKPPTQGTYRGDVELEYLGSATSSSRVTHTAIGAWVGGCLLSTEPEGCSAERNHRGARTTVSQNTMCDRMQGGTDTVKPTLTLTYPYTCAP